MLLVSRTFSDQAGRVVYPGVGLVWLVYFGMSLVMLFYLLPIPITIAVFAAVFLRRAPTRDAAFIAAAFAAVFGVICLGLIAISPQQERGFAEISILSFGVAAYTVAARALAVPHATSRDAA